jgi:hypothetical protein
MEFLLIAIYVNYSGFKKSFNGKDFYTILLDYKIIAITKGVFLLEEIMKKERTTIKNFHIKGEKNKLYKDILTIAKRKKNIYIFIDFNP